jgi:hypothetical protein
MRPKQPGGRHSDRKCGASGEPIQGGRGPKGSADCAHSDAPILGSTGKANTVSKSRRLVLLVTIGSLELGWAVGCSPANDRSSDSPGEASGGSGTNGSPVSCENFSFFLTSLAAMQRLSGSTNGFGGDLRYGETDGLAGADKICGSIAATALPCAAGKVWRAFLSTSTVDAIDRIGQGPWYDRNGYLVWNNLGEMTADRPPSSYSYRDDLPNEDGIPNHDYDLDGDVSDDDNHDVLTGSGTDGRKSADDTLAQRCDDWTSTTVSTGTTTGHFGGGGSGPWCGHSWPRQGSGTHWSHSIREGGCGACVQLQDAAGPTSACVGSGGGYGGFYCFATTA